MIGGSQNLKTPWVVPRLGFFVLAVLPAVAAQAAAGESVAEMAVYGGSASFSPLASFGDMTLTVAGEGHVMTQRVGPGQTASFAPVDREGYQLPDGTYNWEIVTSPGHQSLRPSAVRNVEISADGRTVEVVEMPRGLRQSGVFTIKDGIMVDPKLVEVESSRAMTSRMPVADGPPSAAERSAEHRDQDSN